MNELPVAYTRGHGLVQTNHSYLGEVDEFGHTWSRYSSKSGAETDNDWLVRKCTDCGDTIVKSFAQLSQGS